MNIPSWDLTIAYQGLSDPKIEQDLAAAEALFPELAKLDVTSLEGVAAALTKQQAERVKVMTLGAYVNCILSVDAADEQAKKLLGRVNVLQSQLDQAMTPFMQAIVNLSLVDFEALLEMGEGEEALSSWRFLLERERLLKPQQLTVAEEQLLTALDVDGKLAWGRLYDNITGSMKVTLQLPDGQQERMGLSQAASLLYGGDSMRREPAWRAISEAMTTHQESFAAILNALSGARLTEYQKRSHTQPVHFLDPSLHTSRIEKATLDAMMAVARGNRHIGQKAGLLMARLFGTDKLKPWDEMASMPALSGGDASTYSFAQGIAIIREAFAGVDPEMAEFVDMMVEKQLIDAAPQPNKRLGAYCTKFADSRLPLVFMTWGGSMSDVLTLAHELGHAFHNWVMQDMPLVQTRYPMTLAETASIFAENVVRDALMEKASDEQEKLLMLWEEAQSALALMVNIPVRYEFEKAFYEQRQGGEFTPEQLKTLMSDTWQEWYGEAMDETNEMFWASKLHFSIAEISFYNYPYLFGYLFSKGVYAQREAKGDSFYADYKALLRDTGSMTAEEVVAKHLGMDIRQPEFWQQSVDMVAKQIEEFELVLGKFNGFHH
ncbi:oligoendopeptidase F [Photobacterium gaetbulicola]|uniref:Oligoendopeptidase F n=1 Tax=Photobacterium gaetbulicola TaxID=1295392 RepID=A0A0B9GET7_9GAMM|nr:M3 family oligoendopeptidase [Photobacterium gaetbulicola]KHT63245.1 oligoendopeptidase F [Photobacterium gaetbulicola]